MFIAAIRPNGERPALHVIGANGELTFEDVNLDVIAAAQFLHLGGTPLMYQIRWRACQQGLKIRQGTRDHDDLYLLGIPRPNLSELVRACLPYVDFFMPNYEEAVMICGLTSIDDILRAFLTKGRAMW